MDNNQISIKPRVRQLPRDGDSEKFEMRLGSYFVRYAISGLEIKYALNYRAAVERSMRKAYFRLLEALTRVN